LVFTFGFLLLVALQVLLIVVRVSDNFSPIKRPVTAVWCGLSLPYTLLAGVAMIMALYTRIARTDRIRPKTYRMLKLALLVSPVSMALCYFMRRETKYWGGHMVQFDLLIDEVQGFVIPAITGLYCIFWLIALRRSRDREQHP